jgi:membrane-associated phospholipid phosphatase
VFVALSQLGRVGILWLILGAGAAILWRRPEVFAFVFVAYLVADTSSHALRRLIGRDRPPVANPDPTPLVTVPGDPAFPSGHASTSFACAAVLTWLTPLSPAPLFAVAALVAISRVYVGVHYPLDVVGGAVLGVAVATALRLLVEARRRSAPAPPPG